MNNDTSPSQGTTNIATHNPFAGNQLGQKGMPLIVAAEVGDRVVKVEFADGTTSSFHHQWLRHCCYCQRCGNPADGIRFTTVISFDRDTKPDRLLVEDGNLKVVWLDEHESVFGNDWLYLHAYDNAQADRRRSWRPTLWRAGLEDSFPSVEWPDANDNAAGQLRLYELLRDFGIVRVANVPDGSEGTEQLASLIGPIHETSVYGRIYDVKAEPVAKLGAKTGMAQAPHIDDAFYYSPPGIDVFHCVVSSESGGVSTYVDGFAIAADIEATKPDAYRALTTLPVAHIRRHPGEIDLRSRGPLVQLDEFGRLAGIRYFDRALAPLDIAADHVDRMYDSIREFNRRMVSDEFTARIRVAPNEGVLIDNHRVMHGRTAFDPSEPRHIRLCHVPRDEFHGRLRELGRNLAPLTHDVILPAGASSIPSS